MTTIRDNLEKVRKRIAKAATRSGRNPNSITLVAISKTKTLDEIQEAYEAGQRIFGENYAQELAKKATVLQGLEIAWHFVGHLQRNKAKLIVPHIQCMETLDSESLALTLNRLLPKPVDAFLEVNVGDESSKAGMAPDEVGLLLEKCHDLKCLKIRGLMCIPPFDNDPEKSRPFFQRLRKLAETFSLTELSMGMSHDLEVAIEEGATTVRVGTAIFGERL